MGALLSLPLMTVFLLPAFTSYTTTLNAMFFYMTWMTLVLSHSALRVEMFGTIAVRLLFYWVPSFLFYLFDLLTPSASIVIKASGEISLPASKRKGKTGWMEFLGDFKIPGWALLNLGIGITLQLCVEWFFVSVLGVRSAIRVSIKVPMPWDILKQMFYGLCLRECLTYSIHRFILYSRKRYPVVINLAKWHDKWYHDISSPFPLSAHYDHPVTYLIGTFIPTYFPALFFRFHMLTYLVYMAIISIEETFAYSGYKIMPTAFFLGGIARRIDYHCLSRGEGNFGPWGILDWFCGTSIGDSMGDNLIAGFQERMIDESIQNAFEANKRKIKADTLRRNTAKKR
ncbi:sterol desaturase family [Penicillium taxi]|uniref:sterol desaturase family n=1 Tax=Penicillium taxi TaxID=168475 RepID=UPI002545300D|nr:sterol desaturase family [Penicillium taxi]KAJ5902182.1 sterol desaturase family [Penicillium taxi]